LEAWVDLGALKIAPRTNCRLQRTIESISAFARGASLQCWRARGFFERLRRGTYLAHILEHVVLELQR